MNRTSFRRLLIALSLWLLTYPVALGWNKATHMAIGSIAYRDLQSTAPQTADRIVALLKQHPYYRSQWFFQMDSLHLSADQQSEYLFMLAARWPDDIRGKDAYHDHPSWHYIDYVYAPQQGIIRSDSTLPTGETILQAYALNRQILTGNAPDSARAVALCWLFHLTGDVHMPLHTAALIDPKFPKGDQGGNLFTIKVLMSSPTRNLHSFWDNILLSADDYSSVAQLATQLQQAVHRTQLSQLGSIDITTWSKESFQLAQDNAYRSHTLQSGTKEDGALLPPDYVATIIPIAQRQVVLSGYRLADELTNDLAK